MDDDPVADLNRALAIKARAEAVESLNRAGFEKTEALKIVGLPAVDNA
jgi:hypothetical protein